MSSFSEDGAEEEKKIDLKAAAVKASAHISSSPDEQFPADSDKDEEDVNVDADEE